MIPASDKDQAMWCSWLPATAHALARTHGPVLEIGVGHFSTPFLHEYCKAAGRSLVSAEDNAGWMEKFAPMTSDGHDLISGDYATTLPPLAERRWSLVFIDNSPGGDGRAMPFRLFRYSADFIVVHDYHRENEEAIAPMLRGHTYCVYREYQPPTFLVGLI